jgi:hypothetical protein
MKLHHTNKYIEKSMFSAKDKRTGLRGCCFTFLVTRFIYITDAFNKPERQVFLMPNPVAMLRPRKYITTYVACLGHILTTILHSLSGLRTSETWRRAVIARRNQSIQSKSGQVTQVSTLKNHRYISLNSFRNAPHFLGSGSQTAGAPQKPSILEHVIFCR